MMDKILFRSLLLSLLSCCLAMPGYASGRLGTPNPQDIRYPDGKPPTAAQIELGKKLFFDPRLSVNQTQSCATCHNPSLGFGDMQEGSIGALGQRLDRNTPPLYNLAWNTVFFWDGRARSLEEQALGPIEAKGEMAMPIAKLLPMIRSIPGYRQAFAEAYGETGVSKDNLARAIAAYERTLISNNAPFDRYLAGDHRAMSPAAVRGLKLFEGKARCIKCHDGPNFTDESFHNVGVGDADKGRGRFFSGPALQGAFKTPGLRNVALTAPYLHDGSEPTLESVIRFYNRGGNSTAGRSDLIEELGMSEQEIADLVAFLGALTDPIVITPPQLPASGPVVSRIE